jgi:hypothetical protein
MQAHAKTPQSYTDIVWTPGSSSRAAPAPGSSALAIFESLQHDWDKLARTRAAIAEASRWAEAEPQLLGGGPREVVSRVAWTGYRPVPDGAAVLSALLHLAVHPFAARTLLHVMLPRIRAERVRTPTYGHCLGESWPTPEDTLADLVAECFTAIKRHAGEDRADADRLIVSEAARRLRTARQVQHRYQCRTASLPEGDLGRASGDLSSGISSAERLARALVSAVREGCLRQEQARLLYATRVKGMPASEVARCEGIPPGAIYYAISTAERALLAGTASRSGRQASRSGDGRPALTNPALAGRPAA